MARYSILARMMALPQPMAIGSADTPADAVRKARAFAQDGQRDLQIEEKAGELLTLEAFANKHGIR